MKTSATAIIHILTNSVLNFEVQNEIIKNDISDFFVIFFFLLRTTLEKKNINEYITRRDIIKSSVENVKSYWPT